MSDYERRTVEAIAQWKGEVPGAVSRTLGVILQPLGRLGERLVPESALRKTLGTLDGALDAGKQVEKFLKEAGARSVEELRSGPLERCDSLARRGGVRAERLALGMGAVAGAGGLPTEVAGIPILLTAAVRSIHRIGLCYGYRLDGSSDRQYLLGVLELSAVEEPARREVIRQHLERMAHGEIEDASSIELGDVEREMAGDLALEVVPAVGDVAAIILDYSMMKRVDRTARMVFRERWLRDAGRIEDAIAPAPVHPRDEALRDLRDLTQQVVYLAGYGLGFGVTLPVAALGRAARWLPQPAVRGAEDGARDAVRSVDEFRAGLRETAGRHTTTEPAVVSTG
jgi:hypothetical protein